jgi:hypothetical protein
LKHQITIKQIIIVKVTPVIKYNPFRVLVSTGEILLNLSGKRTTVCPTKPIKTITSPSCMGVSGKFSMEKPQIVDAPPIAKENNQ